MLVGNRMTKQPVTITDEELLSQAQEKMAAGRFHRLPVVDDGNGSCAARHERPLPGNPNKNYPSQFIRIIRSGALAISRRLPA